MDIFYAILAGLIQGLTEFLPVSSTGHLVIFHALFNFTLLDNLIFDVMLHLGTLLALLVFFLADIRKYIIAFFRSFTKWQLKDNLDQRLAWLIAIGTMPAVILGYFFEDIITDFLRQPYWVATSLILVAILFFIIEKIARPGKELNSITGKNAFFIGLAQAIALIPGISRSGITILAGLSIGLKRELAARFAFLLSIPIIFGAVLKSAFDLSSLTINAPPVFSLMLALLTAALSGYWCLKYFLKYLQKNTLIPFAYYRIILGLVIIGYFYLIK